MNTQKHQLVTGIVGVLLMVGTMGSAAPVAADEPQVGVIHDTSAGLNTDPVVDDRSDRDSTSVKAAGATSETAAPSVNTTVAPVLAAPNALPGAQRVGDDDRNLIQSDTQN